MIFIFVLIGSLPAKVEARANLTAYLTVPPTDWYPFGKYVEGTTGFYITHSLGWYNVTVMGNVGIGDGSARVLNNSSNQLVNYSANNFMAADISMAPWDRSRLTSAPPLYETPAAPGPANETKSVAGNATSTKAENATGTGDITAGMPDIHSATLRMPRQIGFDDNNTSLSPGVGNEEAVPKNTGLGKANNTTPIFSNLGPNVPLNDVYHPILMGRPIDDMFYEYPLANSVTMYARLIGLSTPGGCPINMGIACLGYGY